MEAIDLIAIARTLAAGGNATNPHGATDTELRKAISCAYYATFHTLCRAYADVMVGLHAGTQREQDLWNLAYRSIDHGPARNKCNDIGSLSRFSPDIQNFATRLVDLQQHRHQADYDPGATFDNLQVDQIIAQAEDALASFNNAPPNEIRLFITYLASRPRRQ